MRRMLWSLPGWWLGRGWGRGVGRRRGWGWTRRRRGPCRLGFSGGQRLHHVPDPERPAGLQMNLLFRRAVAGHVQLDRVLAWLEVEALEGAVEVVNAAVNYPSTKNFRIARRDLQPQRRIRLAVRAPNGGNHPYGSHPPRAVSVAGNSIQTQGHHRHGSCKSRVDSVSSGGLPWQARGALAQRLCRRDGPENPLDFSADGRGCGIVCVVRRRQNACP